MFYFCAPGSHSFDIWLITYLFTEVLDGRGARITHGVEEALGRPTIDFEDYVKRTVAYGVWAGDPE